MFLFAVDITVKNPKESVKSLLKLKVSLARSQDTRPTYKNQ